MSSSWKIPNSRDKMKLETSAPKFMNTVGLYSRRSTCQLRNFSSALSGNYSTTAKCCEARKEEKEWTGRRKKWWPLVAAWKRGTTMLPDTRFPRENGANNSDGAKDNGTYDVSVCKISYTDCNFHLTVYFSSLSLHTPRSEKLVRYRVKAQRNIKGIVSPSVPVAVGSRETFYSPTKGSLPRRKFRASSNPDRCFRCQFMRLKSRN